MSSKHQQKSILHKVKSNILKNSLIGSGEFVVVALSGGPDSVCLFDILYKLQKDLGFRLAACHYNHKLRDAEGDYDELFVQKICAERGVELLAESRKKNQPINNEDDARKLRYTFFEKILSEKGRVGQKIALAHHLNDLSETFLMRVLRGGGLRGLSSILPQRKNFIRPLLYVSKYEIMAYLKDNSLEFRTDSTNLCNDYFRNQIRNMVLPNLSHYNPNIIETLARIAMMISLDYDYLNKQVEEIYSRQVRQEARGLSFNRSSYMSLHPSLKRHLIVYCIVKLNGKDYTYSQIEQINLLIEQNIGKKILPLPYSLRFEIKNGRIYIYKVFQELIDKKKEHNDGKSQKK